MQPNWRDKYRNPSPPPGHSKKNPRIELKDSYRIIDGVTCEFLGIIIDSGVLEDSNPSSHFSPQTSDEEEVVEVPFTKKVALVIDLEEDESSDVAAVINLKKNRSPDVEPVINLKENQSSDVAPVINLAENQSSNVAPFIDLEVDQSSDVPPVINLEEEQSSDVAPKISIQKSTDKKYASHYKKSPKNYPRETADSSSHSKKKLISEKKYSKSSRDSDNVDSDYKKNLKHYTDYPVKPEPSLGRFYHCKICKASMNNQMAYESHMNGKKHLKTLKQQNVVKAVEDSVNTATVLSRYPLPAPNVCRLQTADIAKSQKVIEEHVNSPCPGLNKVIEIQGLHETHYYCKLCEAPCNSGSIVPHLRGFPHQWQCLKYFDPKKYELLSNTERHKLKGKVIKILKEIELKEGRGKLTVEKEFPKKESIAFSSKKDPSRSRNEDMLVPSHLPGPSRMPEKVFAESYSKTIIPDMSNADFYCPMCDSHMNNQQMWESHIRGKRHITNCKKGPGEALSKKKSILVPNARSILMDELVHVSEPVVGLDHIRETQKPEVSGAMYNCYLCGACCGAEADMIDHILSHKHRMKYLEKINHPDMMLLSEMDMMGSGIVSIVMETCAQVETEIGRGKIEVHVTKTGLTW